MSQPDWHDLGPTTAFSARSVTATHIGRVKLTVTHKDGEFGVISGVCNHKGGPLGGGERQMPVA
jgi:nitrite reductase/ring-hydroxylating ferredoxin subunit